MNESNGDLEMIEAEPRMKVSELIEKLSDVLERDGDVDINFGLEQDRYSETYHLLAGQNKLVKVENFHEEPSW